MPFFKGLPQKIYIFSLSFELTISKYNLQRQILNLNILRRDTVPYNIQNILIKLEADNYFGSQVALLR